MAAPSRRGLHDGKAGRAGEDRDAPDVVLEGALVLHRLHGPEHAGGCFGVTDISVEIESEPDGDKNLERPYVSVYVMFRS